MESTLLGSRVTLSYAVSMIGIYLCVSSQAQKSDSQRAEIQQWLDLHGYDPETVLWFEDQETGATLKRTVFRYLAA